MAETAIVNASPGEREDEVRAVQPGYLRGSLLGYQAS